MYRCVAQITISSVDRFSDREGLYSSSHISGAAFAAGFDLDAKIL